MALIVADRVKETTTTTGTGTLSLAGAVAGFQSFVAGVGTTNTTYYAIADSTTGDWEVGIGTVTSGTPDTLSRDTVLESSNSDNLVNFGAGPKVVICTQPAEKAVYLDASDQLVINGAPVTATATELNYVDGVTSNVQTQLDAKVVKSGDTMTGNLSFGDNNKAIFGTGGDLQIYHTGSNSYIAENGTGSLIILGYDTKMTATGAATYLENTNTGYGLGEYGVKIRHITSSSIASEKLKTTSTGIDVTGNITVSGTVDGVDIATGATNWDTAYGWGDHASAGYATQTYVDTAVSNLVDSAPATLDTLNELAAALGDDANFSTTVTNSLASKASLTGSETLTNKTLGATTAAGNFIPDTDSAYTLGNATHAWLEVFTDELSLNDSLTIGSQQFIAQGTNGFSVNEDYDPSNSATQTAYHFTSGSGRTELAFTLARTSSFTNGFGIYGDASDNKFVLFGEQNNTNWEWRTGVGIQPLDLDGGTLRLSLSNAGTLDLPNHNGSSTGLSLGGTLVTATAAELNLLDGVTATTAELNYVDGVTSNIQTQLNAKQDAATALTTSTTFGGDVSGAYNAIVVANDSHTHDTRYFTETEADARFLGITAKAADSNLLDGLDSSQFLRSDANDSTSGTLTVQTLSINSNTVGTTSDIALSANVAINAENSLSFGMTNATDGYYRWMFGNTSKTSGTGGGTEKMRLDKDGNLTLSGTVDGRDVATDGTKLDGIESGATADQTASEILTAIKTVDGSGSGLDADLLDGQHGAYYQPASTALTTSTTFGGDVSGTYNAIVVADDSHNHIISNVDGLQTALDAKLNTSGGTISGSLTIGDGVTLQESTDRADLLQITSNTSIWGGIQIRNSSNEGRWSFMTDGEVAGIYNDEDNFWHLYFNELGATELRHGSDGSIKLATNTGGVTITGTATATTFSGALSGNATTATTLQTARTIALGGDVTGSASFNGSANITITAAVADDSHNHSSSSGNFTINGQATVTSGIVVDGVTVGRGSGTNTTNTACGLNALTLNTSGTNQTAVGHACLDVVTNGINNTGVGSYALTSATSGSDNVAVGYQALEHVTVGPRNTAVGSKAGRGTNATGVTNSVFVGASSGYDSTGSHNVYVGAFSAYDVNGSNNVYVGAGASGNAIAHASSFNVGVGYRALYNLSGGSGNNTCIGYLTGSNISTGYSNAYYGSGAGSATTTGYRNTCIGTSAGTSITTGNTNICLGYAAEPSSATSTGQCTLGNTSITNLRCNDTTISSLSDARDKTNIIDSPFGLAFISTLRPRQFMWQSRDGNGKDGWTRLGFIAQELLEATAGQNDILDLVMEDNPDRLEAKMGNLVPIIVKSIQDLKSEHDALASRVDSLENAG